MRNLNLTSILWGWWKEQSRNFGQFVSAAIGNLVLEVCVSQLGKSLLSLGNRIEQETPSCDVLEKLGGGVFFFLNTPESQEFLYNVKAKGLGEVARLVIFYTVILRINIF